MRKPSGPGAPEQLCEDLASFVAGPRGSGLRRWRQTAANHRISATHKCALLAASRPSTRELIAVGASTGGPPVVRAFLERLPANLEAPVVITQHIPASRVEQFAAHLTKTCGRSVAIPDHEEPLEPGRTYLAGHGQHLLITRRGTGLVALLDDGPPEHNCKPAVDPMFRSIAAACGSACVGVVMTGMGNDGGAGAVALHEAGAPVAAQDQETSVVWEMPGAVVEAQAAHAILPGNELADWFMRCVAPSVSASRRHRA